MANIYLMKVVVVELIWILQPSPNLVLLIESSMHACRCTVHELPWNAVRATDLVERVYKKTEI